MAIISCFSQAESLRGVLVCLNDTGGVAGLCAVALGLGIWIVAQVGSEAAAKKRLAKVMKYGKPAIASPPTFGGQQHAETVHLFANRDYYQFLLSEFEKALFAQGYELTTDSTRHVVPDSDSTRDHNRSGYLARAVTIWHRCSQTRRWKKKRMNAPGQGIPISGFVCWLPGVNGRAGTLPGRRRQPAVNNRHIIVPL